MEQPIISSDLIRGHIDTIILHTLLENDKFAQQISDSIELKSENKYKINQATLYSSLKRLESLKYVKSYMNDSPSGRRKFFKLTDLGKTTVETNLSSWSYSRAIIDKLMDCETTVIRTEYVERIVEKPVEVVVEKPVVLQESPILPQNIPQVQTIDSDSERLNQNIEKPIEQHNQTTSSTQDINFRSILNGLIFTNATQKPSAQTEELKPIDRVDVVESSNEVQSFNQTIDTINYNADRNNNGKIDFGDLTLKAAKEGYKIRISSKDSCVVKGSILTNKLNFWLSVLIFAFVIVGLIASYVFLLNDFIYKDIVLLASIVIASIIPFVNFLKYINKPKETSKKAFVGDDILTMAIIAFNVILITVALNLICDVNFANLTLIALTVVLPISVSVLLILNATFGVIFSNSKAFKIIQK